MTSCLLLQHVVPFFWRELHATCVAKAFLKLRSKTATDHKENTCTQRQSGDRQEEEDQAKETQGWPISRPHSVGPSQKAFAESTASEVAPLLFRHPSSTSIVSVSHGDSHSALSVPPTYLEQATPVTLSRPFHTTTAALSHSHHRIKVGNKAISLSEVVLVGTRRKGWYWHSRTIPPRSPPYGAA